MNRIQTQRTLAVLLAFCILILGGLASAQCLTHETHHEHHQKGTHGTVLCTWMCASGQVIYGNAAPYLIEQPSVILPDNTQFVFIPYTALDNATSRGPPFLSTI